MKNTNITIAGFGKRALSFLFDLLIINIIIIWPFQQVFDNYVSTGLAFNNISGSMMDAQLPGSIYFLIFIIFFLAMLYFMFFEYYLGQTIGQMFFDIKIISKNDNSGSISLWQSFVRTCFMLPIFPFYVLWIAEPLYLAFYKERLTERLTGTSTVIASKSKGYLKEYKLQKVK